MTAKIDVKLDETKAAAAAEKAYAAATGQVEAKAVEAKPAVVEAAPAQAAVEAKPAVEAAPVAAKVAAKVADVAFPAKPARAAAKKAVAPAKAAPKPATPAKVAVKKTVSKKAAKPVTANKTVKKIAKASAKPAAKPSTITKLKDQIMTTTKTTTEDFTAKIQTAVADAQDRAKTAFEKGQAAFGEYGEFAKGNVEALVESGKILAAGLQDMGKDYVAEGKTAFETMTADVKAIAAVKSPADFFKLQGEILRRNFDAAVTSGSKTSEKVVKLANETFAPIQNRVSLAIEKVKQAA